MDDDPTFGQWLRYQRKIHDLTQTELAGHITCAVGTVRKLERDQLRPSKALAERVATVLGVPTAARPAFLHFARGTGDYSAIAVRNTVVPTLEPVAATDTGSGLSSPAGAPGTPAGGLVAPHPSLPFPVIKLSVPRMPARLVVRDRLLGHLDCAVEHRLTLVSAAAGWGKTTLLSTWARQHTAHTAWLSLDELDNAAVRFWSAVIATLRQRMPAMTEQALAMLEAPEPVPLPVILTVLLNDLTAAPTAAPVVLVLDDYHHIDDDAIHESVAFFIEHLPPSLTVMLATRVDPSLPLARWRARGELLEVRAADLSFTSDEAGSFLTQTLGDTFAYDDVQRLQRRTEGWIAGLHLAALALRQRSDHAAFVAGVSGSHRFLLDYIQEEIIAPQPLAVQRFLLQVAVLRRLNDAVCAAVTGDADSQVMLERLERGNLFIVPLDDARQWYRLHDLFREMLLARLAATEPALVPRLHQRAASWYAAQGDLREAITHAHAAGDGSLAARLIARAAPQLWRHGDAGTVHAWIARLPDGTLIEHGRLALDAALQLLLPRNGGSSQLYLEARSAVELTIARIEAGIGPEPPADGAGAGVLRRRIQLLRALLATRAILTRGDAEDMRRLAEEAAALVAREERHWQLLALNIAYWHAESLERAGAVLLPRLLEAKQQLRELPDPVASARVMSWLAVAYQRAGRPRQAVDECMAALAGVEPLAAPLVHTGYLHYFLADAYLSMYQLAAAASATQRALAIAQTWQHADLLLACYHALLRLALARGDAAAAEQALLEAERLLQHEGFALHSGVIAAARVRFWLATGNLEAAGAWAAQLQLPRASWNPNRTPELLLLVRVQLAQQQYAEALTTLEHFSAELDRPGASATMLEAQALLVLALDGNGQRSAARRVAARLLGLTAREGMISVYLELGAPMHELLRSLSAAPPEAEPAVPPECVAHLAQLLAAFEQHSAQPARRQVEQPDEDTWPAASTTHDGGVEPLTRREYEVLHLLEGGASNAEIAQALVISIATVKKHVSSLLGKLGAPSRTHLIARARAG